MSKVLILGAGASFGHGYRSYTGTVLHPPLVKDFFNHPLFTDISEKYQELLDYLEEQFGYGPSQLSQVDIEKLFGQIEPLWRLHILESPRDNHDTYNEDFIFATPLELLRAFITDVVFLSTKWLSTAECPIHKWLVMKWLETGDTIVSFNYDLIIDVALRRNSSWKEANGYGWAAHDSIDSNDNLARLFQVEYTRPEIELLKPHGSINFSRLVRNTKRELPGFQGKRVNLNRSGDDDRLESYDSIAVTPIDRIWTLYKPGLFADLSRQYRHQYNTDQQMWFQIWKGALGRDGWSRGYLFPLMIVPSPFKQFDDMIFGELQLTWRRAYQVFSEADHAVACGYSFSDPHFNQVIRQATRAREKALLLTLVDPSQRTIEDITKRLGACHIKLTPFVGTLEGFVDSINSHPH